MTETFAALLLAHLVADFILQTRWIVDNKHRPAVLLLHGALVFAATFALLGGSAGLAAGIALSHLLIDAAKTRLAPATLPTFLADQGAHLAVIAAAAWAFPDALGWTALPPGALPAAILAAGAIAATLAGGPAVGLFMAPHAAALAGEGEAPAGLPGAGRAIGLLERALIFLMMLGGQPGGIGFLIAAKSILRFDMASRDQKLGEYVIIGTLASFGWAIAAAQATLWALTLAAAP